jgi:hypothetical protein
MPLVGGGSQHGAIKVVNVRGPVTELRVVHRARGAAWEGSTVGCICRFSIPRRAIRSVEADNALA